MSARQPRARGHRLKEGEVRRRVERNVSGGMRQARPCASQSLGVTSRKATRAAQLLRATACSSLTARLAQQGANRHRARLSRLLHRGLARGTERASAPCGSNWSKLSPFQSAHPSSSPPRASGRSSHETPRPGSSATVPPAPSGNGLRAEASPGGRRRPGWARAVPRGSSPTLGGGGSVPGCLTAARTRCSMRPPRYLHRVLWIGSRPGGNDQRDRVLRMGVEPVLRGYPGSFFLAPEGRR